MLENLLPDILAFLQTNLIIAVVIGAIVVTFFYFKPKEMLKLLAFGLFMAVAFYCLTLFMGTVSSGSKQKDQMIYKSKKLLGE